MAVIKLKDKDYWATPEEIFKGIEQVTGLTFDLDACANAENTKCADFISEEQNTLVQLWGKHRTVFMNPPYSNPLPFVERAIKGRNIERCNVVILLNADTSTRWFSLIQQEADQIYFITEGRIAFLNYQTNERVAGNNRPQMFACFYADKLKKQETFYIKLNDLQTMGATNE